MIFTKKNGKKNHKETLLLCPIIYMAIFIYLIPNQYQPIHFSVYQLIATWVVDVLYVRTAGTTMRMYKSNQTTHLKRKIRYRRRKKTERSRKNIYTYIWNERMKANNHPLPSHHHPMGFIGGPPTRLNQNIFLFILYAPFIII